jgi:hypothetical protein
MLLTKLEWSLTPDACTRHHFPPEDLIKEDRSVYSEEDFIDGVFDDFVPSGYYYDSDNNNAVVSEDDGEHKKRVRVQKEMGKSTRIYSSVSSVSRKL